MFKIEYRKDKEDWQHWMTVARIIDVVNERRRLSSQNFDVRVLDGNNEVISTTKA
jgi:hypothetical protein